MSNDKLRTFNVTVITSINDVHAKTEHEAKAIAQQRLSDEFYRSKDGAKELFTYVPR